MKTCGKTLSPLSQNVVKLSALGFVNITGLPVIPSSLDRTVLEERLVSAHPNDWGCWNSNGPFIVVITKKGEVWLGASSAITEKDLRAVIEVFCPKGLGGNVPCVNGETISLYHLLVRNGKPYYNFEGQYPSKPGRF